MCPKIFLKVLHTNLIQKKKRKAKRRETVQNTLNLCVKCRREKVSREEPADLASSAQRNFIQNVHTQASLLINIY